MHHIIGWQRLSWPCNVGSHTCLPVPTLLSALVLLCNKRRELSEPQWIYCLIISQKVLGNNNVSVTLKEIFMPVYVGPEPRWWTELSCPHMSITLADLAVPLYRQIEAGCHGPWFTIKSCHTCVRHCQSSVPFSNCIFSGCQVLIVLVIYLWFVCRKPAAELMQHIVSHNWPISKHIETLAVVTLWVC